MNKGKSNKSLFYPHLATGRGRSIGRRQQTVTTAQVKTEWCQAWFQTMKRSREKLREKCFLDREERANHWWVIMYDTSLSIQSNSVMNDVRWSYPRVWQPVLAKLHLTYKTLKFQYHDKIQNAGEVINVQCPPADNSQAKMSTFRLKIRLKGSVWDRGSRSIKTGSVTKY